MKRSSPSRGVRSSSSAAGTVPGCVAPDACSWSIQPMGFFALLLELARQALTDLARAALDLAPVAGLDAHPLAKTPFQAPQGGGIRVF